MSGARPNRRTFLTAAMLAATGCAPQAPAPAPLEQTRVRVGHFPVADAAPLYLGVHKGLFKAVGLDVQLIKLDPSGLVDEPEIDVAFSSWIGQIMYAVDTGIPEFAIADGSEWRERCSGLLVLPNSRYRRITDLRKPRIAVDSPQGIGALLTLELCRGRRVEPTFVQIPFDKMETALDGGDADAVWMPEPYLTRLQLRRGATLLADCDYGANQNFPSAGYTALKDFAKRYPNTLAAFIRVLVDCQRLASADYLALTQTIQTELKIDTMTARLMTVSTFPTTLNPTRLQRVADAMLRVGFLTTKFNTREMLR